MTCMSMWLLMKLLDINWTMGRKSKCKRDETNVNVWERNKDEICIWYCTGYDDCYALCVCERNVSV